MLCLALLGIAAPARDEVRALPGWSGALPSRFYSGYVNVTASADRPMLVHYMYIESEGKPATDPTVLWTNGGPGASSMFGLFVELGPFVMNANSLTTDAYKTTGVPTLYANPYGWSKLGSLLMFDWPPPVGFSYCDGVPSGGGTSCGDWDDERMATVQYAALKGWFDLFPERRANDLYLTGESYAGIYVPKLAQQILLHKDASVYPQLKGFAVGDGCLGTESGICGGDKMWWHVLFLYGHGQVCCTAAASPELAARCEQRLTPRLTPPCADLQHPIRRDHQHVRHGLPQEWRADADWLQGRPRPSRRRGRRMCAKQAIEHVAACCCCRACVSPASLMACACQISRMASTTIASTRKACASCVVAASAPRQTACPARTRSPSSALTPLGCHVAPPW